MDPWEQACKDFKETQEKQNAMLLRFAIERGDVEEARKIFKGYQEEEARKKELEELRKISEKLNEQIGNTS